MEHSITVSIVLSAGKHHLLRPRGGPFIPVSCFSFIMSPALNCGGNGRGSATPPDRLEVKLKKGASAMGIAHPEYFLTKVPFALIIANGLIIIVVWMT